MLWLICQDLIDEEIEGKSTQRGESTSVKTFSIFIITLVNVYVGLLVFMRIAGTS